MDNVLSRFVAGLFRTALPDVRGPSGPSGSHRLLRHRSAGEPMTLDPGYLLEVLRFDAEFTLYRAQRIADSPVLALAVTEQHPAPHTIGRLVREHALAAELDPAWAARPLSLTRHEGRLMLLLEDFGGDPLDRILDRARGQPFELASFLRLASNMAAALGQVHRHGLVHKDVKPSNVLADGLGQVRLTGFGIASSLRPQDQELDPPEPVAGTLPYMAPEQTGRMNRSIDARSDLYSLGVTLYELLTGVLPFTTTDPMELIHCHIARQPAPPSGRVPDLPATIEGIVLKLLAKSPEDRYRTAAGVERDLRRCLGQWSTDRKVENFAPGSQDTSDRLRVPERLYGREVEMELLLSALERVATTGTTELVLVSGYAGIGKSSIVHGLHRVLVPRRGLFAAGKFDQYKRDIPYATLVQAFQGLVHQLLRKTDAELAGWRDELLAALGPNGQLMVNLIPELALVIGEQPPVVQIEPQTAQARFHLVFRSLLGVFAKPGRPLLLFLDDLQWSDTGTLQMLARLVVEPEVRHVMLIGAYRDNEVGPSHPLFSALAALRNDGSAVSQISLGPLHVGHLAQLSAEALDTDARHTRPLAELLAEKTGGNPFFAFEFLTALGEDGLLRFDPESSAWRWDIGRIRARGITDNVADLVSAKLSRLPVDTRDALAQLACLGNVADARTVALMRDCSLNQVHATFRDAVEAGLILHLNGSLTFSHDRVQEAAYSLIPLADRAASHLRIARLLLSRTPVTELDEKIFEIVHQYDRGAVAIESSSERDQAAEVYLLAGKRAKASSAFASAQAYFSAGRDLLGLCGWERRYRLTFRLELNRAECEIVIGDLVTAEERLASLSQRAIGLSDQAEVVCLAVLLYFTTDRSERAVEVALEFLAGVGIAWRSRPTETEVRQEYLQMRRNLERSAATALIDLPDMSDPGCIATMAVLTELFPAAYAVDRYLLELVLLRMTNLSLEHGHCEGSSVAYAALNMALGGHLADYTTAYRLGQLACELVERCGAGRYKARVYSCFAAFTMPWIKHLPRCQPLMTHAFRIGSSMGDMAFAAYNSRNLITNLLVSGVPLDQVQLEAERATAFAGQVQLGMPAERFIGQLEVIRRLRGASVERRLADDAWASQDVDQQPGLAMMVCYHWVFRLQERFFARDFPAAQQAAERVRGIRWAMRSSIEEAEYEFYAALACAASVDRGSGAQREDQMLALSNHQARIAVWAQNCPENFADRRALVGAEISRLEGRVTEAQELYETSVRLARKHGFLQIEGIANELAGQFYLGLGLHTAADAYLRNARNCYERWGALGKVIQLDARYPQVRAPSGPSFLTARIDTAVAQLDVNPVDKASQILSSEMALPSLLEKLMRLAVEHAGAEKGLLILLHGDLPCVEAEATTGHGRVEVAVRSARVTPSDLPQSALQYVLRTRQRLVLDDASAEGLDADDEYFSRCHPRSVLCVPIFKQTKVVGALYLENNLTTCAFTADRVAVLDFLASQAAISLENARLYSDLRRSEAFLQEAQHLSSTGSFYWHVGLDTLEFSEQTFRTYGLNPGSTLTLASIATRIHPDDLPLWQEMVDVARGRATDLDYVYRVRMPDLSVKHLHLVAHGSRDKDGQAEYIGAIQDITQRHLAEEALGKVRLQLAHVARVTTLGTLAASIAHEVSQPLSGIVTNSSTCLRMLAADPPNVDGAKETVRRTIRDGLRAADVITRLRALFGNKAATGELVDLNETIREVIALSRQELQISRVNPRAELAADLPQIAGDRVQLQQVILNLLLNASEAMNGVGDRSRQLLITTEREEGNRVRLNVRDTGIGFDAENPGKLFEAFYTTKSDGMGMGLSVSRSIIESHHGRLWATLNEGPGATFSFSVPVASGSLMGSPSAGGSRDANSTPKRHG